MRLESYHRTQASLLGAALWGVFSSGPRDFGHIRTSDFAKAWDLINWEQKKKDLDSYALGKRVPTAKLAWKIGELLRAFGLPWMSGLRMLWACGHLRDVVGILRTYASTPGCDLTAMKRIWHMLSVADFFLMHSPLRKFASLAEFHIKKRVLDRETRTLVVEAVSQKLVGNTSETWPSGALMRACATVYYLDQEDSKRPWLYYEGIRAELCSAADLWFGKRFTWTNDHYANVCLESAGHHERLTPLGHKSLVLASLAYWLRCYENPHMFSKMAHHPCLIEGNDLADGFYQDRAVEYLSDVAPMSHLIALFK